MRNRTFFSLHELNQAIKPLLNEVNKKPFQKLPGSRLSQYEALEKPALKPLPKTNYEFAQWKKAKLGTDYHIELEGHYYSAPYKLIKKELWVRYNQRIVEIFFRAKRVASHRRSYQQGRHTTVIEHMPKGHRAYAAWTPARIINWAKKSGQNTADLAGKIMASRKHPQQGFRSCLGLIRLSKSYGHERLEAACKKALAIGAYNYKSVQSILKNNLEQSPISQDQPLKQATAQNHENVRGGDYFR